MLKQNSSDKPFDSSWLARLKLLFRQSHGETIMADNTHIGPLRVQRTFKAEDESRHVYILHPPGGYVAGDLIDIHVETQDSSHVVVTSPGASKFYRCEPDFRHFPHKPHKPNKPNKSNNQTQTLNLVAKQHSLLEWLPQETIFFKDANAHLETNIQLDAGSDFIGWEISCLGRTASGETFGQGRLTQTLNLFQNDVLIHRERLRLTPEDAIQSQPWGLDQQPVFGTLLAVLKHRQEEQSSSLRFDRQDQLLAVVANLREQISEFPEAQHWSVTTKSGVILVRYLGPHSEPCKNGFSQIRDNLLKTFKQIEASTPRIWAT